MGRPLFLITNDDGVHAPGIRALAAAVEPLGDWIIVAPHVERSGAGQGISLTQPLRMERIEQNIIAVEGTPADCVIFALHRLLDRRPDFVLSGINRGSNIGQDTLYSGTVAGAMEGCVQGLPAIAFSLHKRRAFEGADYADATKIVRIVMQDSTVLEAARKGVLNVNIPGIPLNKIKGAVVTRLGRRIYDHAISENVDPRGRLYYWIGGGGEDIADIPGSDCNALFDDFVTMTVLSPEHIHKEGNELLQKGGMIELNSAIRAER